MQGTTIDDEGCEVINNLQAVCLKFWFILFWLCTSTALHY